MSVYSSRETPWTLYTPTYTGFGTVGTTNMYWRKLGGNLELRGSWIPGITTGVEARVSLPGTLAAADATQIQAVRNPIGHWFSENPSVAPGSVECLSGQQYITFCSGASGANGFTNIIGTSISTTGNTVGFFASIPIAGW